MKNRTAEAEAFENGSDSSLDICLQNFGALRVLALGRERNQTSEFALEGTGIQALMRPSDGGLSAHFVLLGADSPEM
jgi:hypothetical protein